MSDARTRQIAERLSTLPETTDSREAHHLRRAEDRFREEHHDAHAKVIKAGVEVWMERVSSTVVASRKRRPLRAYSKRTNDGVLRRMRIRIIKHLPAPMMDGFDVRAFHPHEAYDVDARVGNYLIVAGYAVRAENEPPEQPKPSG